MANQMDFSQYYPSVIKTEHLKHQVISWDCLEHYTYRGAYLSGEVDPLIFSCDCVHHQGPYIFL